MLLIYTQVVIINLMFVSALGAAYGTAKSGTGIAAMSVMRPELIMKSIIPVVMAGIIAIYGLVVAVLISGALQGESYPLYKYVSHTRTRMNRLNWGEFVIENCGVRLVWVSRRDDEDSVSIGKEDYDYVKCLIIV